MQHPPITIVVAARQTPARGAALVTWEPIVWCGISNPATRKGGAAAAGRFKS